jgi:hypothetical protein
MSHNPGMYIIAIGWLYVTLLVAASEPSLVAGLISFLFYGLLPCALLLWLGGTRARRQRRRLLADQRTNERDAADSHSDQ